MAITHQRPSKPNSQIRQNYMIDVRPLPKTTETFCNQLCELHGLSVKSIAVFSQRDKDDIKFVGTNIEPIFFNRLVDQLKPILASQINHTNLTFEHENLYIIKENEFIFIFIIN